MYLTVLVAFLIASCNNDESNEQLNGNTKKITVKEVLQTSNYTYLSGDVNGNETWIAVTKTAAKPGDVYYYEDGMLMENFVSKELNRTFEKIWFIDNIRTTPEIQKTMMTDTDMNQHNMKPNIEKGEFTIAPVEGGVSVAELYSKKEDYNGKTVTVKGIVTKVNTQIMDRNWIHIQDGTEHEGEYDLTITSQMIVQKGDTIVAEGKISLDKDFGYGYAYKVILEDAKIK